MWKKMQQNQKQTFNLTEKLNLFPILRLLVLYNLLQISIKLSKFFAQT